jgi:hypothetical protein
MQVFEGSAVDTNSGRRDEPHLQAAKKSDRPSRHHGHATTMNFLTQSPCYARQKRLYRPREVGIGVLIAKTCKFLREDKP